MPLPIRVSTFAPRMPGALGFSAHLYVFFNRIELTAKFLPLICSVQRTPCCQSISFTLLTPRLGLANLLANRLSRRHDSRRPQRRSPF